MLYRKNIIIAIAVSLIGIGFWFTSRIPAAKLPLRAEDSAAREPTATSAPEKIPVINNKPAPPARVILAGKTDFTYTITPSTPCGDNIGELDVQSSDASKELYWGMTGAMPIWLTFSQVQGKTPAKVNMIFNCVLSGAEDTIDWKFTVVEMTKEGKYVDGYARIFSLKGDMRINPAQ